MRHVLPCLVLAACVGGTKSDSSSSSTTPPPSTSPATLPVPACIDSTPLPYPDGTPSGYEQCADGRIHRVSAEAAPTPGAEGACAPSSYIYDYQCTSDPDCATDESCRVVAGYSGARCICLPVCTTDADCAPDEACIGWGVFGTNNDVSYCHEVGCKTDADCASGLCGVASMNEGCATFVEMACRTVDDECAVDSDCGAGACNLLTHANDPHYRWTCDSVSCTFR